MKSFNEQKAEIMCEAFDSLISIDFHARGIVKPVYEVLRKKVGEPLTLKAATGLNKALAEDGAVVFISTGFLIAPSMKPETDGPIAAALLARALNIFGAKPVIIAEEGVMACLEGTCIAAEMTPYYDVDKAMQVPHSVALIPYPADIGAAHKLGNELIEKLDPKAMIDIEHPGKGDDGKYYSALGKELKWPAPIDDLFETCYNRGVFTVGIGDLGNEIGFGYAKPEINDLVPYGALVTTKGTCDAPVMSAVSDFGAYGVMAALEAVSGKKGILHSSRLEDIVVKASVIAGAVEGFTGVPTPALDLIDVNYCCAFIEMLHAILTYSEACSGSRPFFIDFVRGAYDCK